MPTEVYAALAYFHDHHDSIVAAIESGKARAERARGPEPVSRDDHRAVLVDVQRAVQSCEKHTIVFYR